VNEDFSFHCAIAEATGNPQFKHFLEYLGRFIIPRRTMWKGAVSAGKRVDLNTFQREHREILAAIRAHSPSQARAAMQRHLLHSRARYASLDRGEAGANEVRARP
jgi:GntR family transcriptional repressor for pyruvate dehydrogenase complex